MKIYTSYFGNVRNVEGAGVKPVGIVAYSPGWLKLDNYKVLAPRGDMLKLPRSEYVPLFRKILAGLNPQHVLADLEVLSDGKDIALMCYEKPPRFCHRQMVAVWLERELGIKVREFPFRGPVQQHVLDL